MAHLITTAIPTDNAALMFLKANPQKYPSLNITPFVAKELYNASYISDKHNFVCPTDGCSAPVTCRSIKPINKNRPTFVNQSISTNMHLSNCLYHPDNYDLLLVTNGANRDTFNNLKSGKTISDLSSNFGFQPLDNSTSSISSTTTSISSNVKKRISNSNGQNTNKKKRIIQNHLKSLEDHVEMYKYNPDFELLTNSSKQPFPIKFMFKFLKKNSFFYDFKKRNYLYIYHSKAYLSKVKKDSVLKLSFKCPILINNKTVFPSLIISKDHIESEYTDIYDQFIKGIKTEFDVYTTLPFLKVASSSDSFYLNFSSFRKEESVNPFSEELFYNLYIN
ncbi:hypothetical protein G15_0254 [Enterococcus avium]|nr:hypothetical protein G15_0254 [Enterococcus avium]